MRPLGEILGVLAVGIFLSAYFHERGWKKGHATGLDKGMKEGYEAGKIHADNFWIHAEQNVDLVRQKMRKEGWP